MQILCTTPFLPQQLSALSLLQAHQPRAVHLSVAANDLSKMVIWLCYVTILQRYHPPTESSSFLTWWTKCVMIFFSQAFPSHLPSLPTCKSYPWHVLWLRATSPFARSNAIVTLETQQWAERAGPSPLELRVPLQDPEGSTLSLPSVPLHLLFTCPPSWLVRGIAVLAQPMVDLVRESLNPSRPQSFIYNMSR